MTPATIVACNIYITAASSHSSKLLSLLRRAQDQCRELRHQHKDDFGRSCSSCVAKIENVSSRSSSSNMIAPIAIVHAYADIPYDRSSFHLAGTPECVSAVASNLICNALSEIDLDCTSTNSNKDGQGNELRHPFVGLVDHVSIMSVDQHTPVSNDNNSNCEVAAKAAREIGKRITATNLVNVHYYGRACPNNTSLATVRRERTSFFKSGGAIDGKDQSSKDTPAVSKTLALQGDTTIGTPSNNFVENFNIRLTSNVNFEQAKTLTQFLRGRNISTKGYGVPGVEALTLPYVREASKGGNVYEVACNLTTPKEGSADDIKMQLDQWIEKQKQQSSDVAKVLDYEYFVEDAYPVGTTEEQCKQVLSQAHDMDNEEYWRKYDREILDNFQELLQN